MTERPTDVWGLADYAPLSARLAPASQRAVAALGPVEGRTVLDVAAGSGTAARLLASAGATVVAVDASPGMVERGRAACAGLAVDWHVADAASLPVDDGRIDAALSSFGVMFAEPSGAVAELGRALRPGAPLALTVWTADGFMVRMGRLMARFTGAPIGDLGAWVRDDGLGRWCADAGFAPPTVENASLPWRFDDAPAMTAFLRAHSPAHVASAAAAGVRAPEMFTAIERLAAPDGGPVDLAAEYVLITTHKEDR